MKAIVSSKGSKQPLPTNRFETNFLVLMIGRLSVEAGKAAAVVPVG